MPELSLNRPSDNAGTDNLVDVVVILVTEAPGLTKSDLQDKLKLNRARVFAAVQAAIAAGLLVVKKKKLYSAAEQQPAVRVPTPKSVPPNPKTMDIVDQANCISHVQQTFGWSSVTEKQVATIISRLFKEATKPPTTLAEFIDDLDGYVDELEANILVNQLARSKRFTFEDLDEFAATKYGSRRLNEPEPMINNPASPLTCIRCGHQGTFENLGLFIMCNHCSTLQERDHASGKTQPPTQEEREAKLAVDRTREAFEKSVRVEFEQIAVNSARAVIALLIDPEEGVTVDDFVEGMSPYPEIVRAAKQIILHVSPSPPFLPVDDLVQMFTAEMQGMNTGTDPEDFLLIAKRVKMSIDADRRRMEER